MKLSIITTVYQAEKDLPRLLDSMRAQESPELEFFLIDNGCTDGSASICADYAAQDERFKILTLKKNIGYIGARNMGLDIVDADYIGFCDSDDYLEPGGYDSAIRILKNQQPDIYITSWNTIDGNNSIQYNPPFVPASYCREQIKSLVLPQVFGEISNRSMLRGFMWKQIIKKTVIGNTRFREDIKPYEDMLFNADVFRRCCSLVISNDTIYNYVASHTSITGQMHKSIDVKSEYSNIKRFYRYMSLIADNSDCRIALANHMLSMVVSMILMSSRINSIHNECAQLNATISGSSLLEMISEAKPRNNIYKLLKILLSKKSFLPIVLLAKFRK